MFIIINIYPLVLCTLHIIAGKAAAKADPLMAETSTSGSAHSSKIWPSSLVRWWLSTGRNQPKNSLSVMVPSSSAHCISKTVLGNKLTAAAQEASSSPVFRGSTTLPVEVEGPVEQANSLYFGWYYHPVRVCEKCYKVYTELDRYRKLRFKHLIKQQEKSDENDPKKWREIEARIFRQRQFVSRLAKLDTAASAAQHSSHYYQQQAGILGSHSMAFDSVLEGSGKFENLLFSDQCMVIICIFSFLSYISFISFNTILDYFAAQEGVAFGRAYKLNASRSDGQLRASEQNSYRGGECLSTFCVPALITAPYTHSTPFLVLP